MVVIARLVVQFALTIAEQIVLGHALILVHNLVVVDVKELALMGVIVAVIFVQVLVLPRVQVVMQRVKILV